MHKFEIKEKEKIFLLTTSGLLKESDSITFVNDWNEMVSKINQNDYYLIQDASDQVTTASDLVGPLKQFMKMISETSFKKLFFVMPKSSIAVSQINRVAKELGFFDRMTPVNSYEEALKLIK